MMMKLNCKNVMFINKTTPLLTKPRLRLGRRESADEVQREQHGANFHASNNARLQARS